MADEIKSGAAACNDHDDSSSSAVNDSGNQEEKKNDVMLSLPKKASDDGNDDHDRNDIDNCGNQNDSERNDDMKGYSDNDKQKGQDDNKEFKTKNIKKKRKKRKNKRERVKCVTVDIHDDIISMATNMMMLPNSRIPNNNANDAKKKKKKTYIDPLVDFIPSNQYECILVRRGIWEKKKKSSTRKDQGLPTIIQNDINLHQQQQPNHNLQNISKLDTAFLKPSANNSNNNAQQQQQKQHHHHQQQQQQRRSIFGVPLIDSFSPPTLPGIAQQSTQNNPNTHQSQNHPNPYHMTENKEEEQEEEEEEEEVYIKGDLALGMKLNVQKGFVVVGAVTSLVDGRASPAQLTGLIQKGDILVSINGISLLHIPLEQLWQRLKLLSSNVDNNTNNSSTTTTNNNSHNNNNSIKKKFTLRFINTTSNKTTTSGNNKLATVTDKTITAPKQKVEFGFVDQFSGLPLFPPTMEEPTSESFAITSPDEEKQPHDDHNSTIATNDTKNNDIVNNNIVSAQSLFHQKVSSHLAYQRRIEKQRYTSQFFTLNPEFSKLLRSESIISSSSLSIEPNNNKRNSNNTNTRPLLTKKEWIELGTLAMAGARIICDEMEFGKLCNDSDEVDNDNNTMPHQQKGKRKDPLAIIWSDGRSFSSRSRFSKTSSNYNNNSNHTKKNILFTVEDDSLEEDDDDSFSGYDSDQNINSNKNSNINENNSGAEDELLLQLAASNDEWKLDMIHALEQLSVEKREMESSQQNDPTDKQHEATEKRINLNDNNHEMKQQNQMIGLKTSTEQDLTPPTSHRRKSLLNTLSDDVEMEHQLTSLLFGEENVKKMNKIIKNKSAALPPDDFTAILYDISLVVSNTLPRNISIKGPDFSTLIETDKNDFDKDSTENQKSLNNYDGNNSNEAHFIQKVDQDLLVASTFLIQKAVPVWLKTFRPLPWKQRFLFWPVGGNYVPYDQETLSSGLSLTSSNTGWKNESRKKKLEEMIEDIEMNPESRNETCSLVLFYFTRKLLPEITQKRSKNTTCKTPDTSNNLNIEDEAISFVEEYGSYLDLFQALFHSAEIHAERVIESLLEMAAFDPGHCEVMDKLSKGNILLLYENNMLSALLSSIPNFVKISNKTKRRDQIALFVSAYPDLKPWQIRNKIAMTLKIDEPSTNNPDSSLYYEYLSMLLHPKEGIDIARQEPDLVKEWCKLSLSQYKDSPDLHGLMNFLSVASKSGEEWMCYHRDLPILLELSMTFNKNDFDLALNLAQEIINHDQYCMKKKVLETTLSHISLVAKFILENTRNEYGFQPQEIKTLSKAIKLMQSMGSSESVIVRDSIDVSNQIMELLQVCNAKQEHSLLCLLADTVSPTDVLHTLKKWNKESPKELNISILSALRIALAEGANEGLQTEISGTLLRLKYARRTDTLMPQSSERNSFVNFASNDLITDEGGKNHSWDPSSGFASGMIWKKLSRGVAYIEK